MAMRQNSAFFTLFFLLIIAPNLAFADHFENIEYKDANERLIDKMVQTANQKIRDKRIGDDNKFVDTSVYERILATQIRLNNVGLSAGAEDGIWGTKTETALVTYLNIRGIDFDGKLDSNELKILSIPTKKLKKNRRVFYFGFGLYGNEPWSTNDAVEVGAALERFYPNRTVVKFIFSGNEKNNLPVIHPSLPYFAKPLNYFTRHIGKKDLVIIGLYSHGSASQIIQKIGNKHSYGITSGWLWKHILSPLKYNNVALIISSCYSGAFIERLKASNLLIATAAAADRASFGCSPKSKGTVYAGALQKTLNQSKYQANYNLTDVFIDTQKLIKNLEISRGEKKPSNPKLFEGIKFFD